MYGIVFLIVLIGMVIIFFKAPYSRTRSEFAKLKRSLAAEERQPAVGFSEEELDRLPTAVRTYVEFCGYAEGAPVSHLSGRFRSVTFYLSRSIGALNIDYSIFNTIGEPARIALINSRFYGLPFEGLDVMTGGIARQKGVLAKVKTLFNQTGDSMCRAHLITFLSECIAVPAAFLQDYVVWEEIDSSSAEATIRYGEIEASGIFTFDREQERVTFLTNDREVVAMDGSVEQIPWEAVYSGFEESGGIKQPGAFEASWKYEEGDFTYFSCTDISWELGSGDQSAAVR